MSLFYVHGYGKKNKQHSPTSLDCVTGYDYFLYPHLGHALSSFSVTPQRGQR